MIDRLDRDAINQAQRAESRQAKLRHDIFKSDVQHAMGQPGVRRILWQFLQDMGTDTSPFATNAMAQSHAIGMQDAAKWWLNVIRDCCEEREAQMRTEANKAVEAATQLEDDNDH